MSRTFFFCELSVNTGVYRCAVGLWGDSFISKAIGDLNPVLAAQRVLSMRGKKLMVHLDYF